MALLNNRRLESELSKRHFRNAHCASLTSSLMPLLTKHDTSAEIEITNQYLEESHVAEDASVSTITITSALTPLETTSGRTHQVLTSLEDPKPEHSNAALPSFSSSHHMTPTSPNSVSQPDMGDLLYVCPYSTDLSTTNSTYSSITPSNSDCISLVSIADSFEPILHRAACTSTEKLGEEEEAKPRAHGDQQVVLARKSEELATSKTATWMTTTMPDMGDIEIRPLPSSTLLGHALRPTSRSNTTITASRPCESLKHQPILRKSTEDMIKLIYELQSSGKSSVSMTFHETIKHDHAQSQRQDERRQNQQTVHKSKLAQWQDLEFDDSRRDDMSDILDAYFVHDAQEDSQRNQMRIDRRIKLEAQKSSARDREKAAAKKIFRAESDWQDLDKISKFLRVTKDLTKP